MNLNTIATLDDERCWMPSHHIQNVSKCPPLLKSLEEAFFVILVFFSFFCGKKKCEKSLKSVRVKAIVDVMWKEEVPSGKAIIQQGDLQAAGTLTSDW